MLPASHHPVTVEEALRLPPLRIGVPEVIAGEAGLGRPIRWVHAGEIPELSTFLKGGELLLTTGMGMPSDSRAAQRWLRDLHQCGISGLVVELGSAIKSVPRPMIVEADRLGLPLIVLHRKVAFVEATEVIHRRILAHQTSVLEQGEAAHRRLSDLMVDGATTSELLQALAELLDAPVVLARSTGAILFQASHTLRETEVASLWESRRRGLEGAPNAVALPIRMGGDSHWAELAAISDNGPLSPVDLAVLERAAPSVAVSLRHDRESHAFTGHTRGEFLYMLAREGLEMTEAEAADRAAILDFDRRTPCLLPAVVSNCAGFLHDDQWEQISGGLRGAFRKSGKPAVVGFAKDVGGVLLVVGLAADDERLGLAERVGETAQEAAAQASASADSIQVSVGRVARGWRDLGVALRDTIQCSAAARWRSPAVWHDVATPDVPDLLDPLRGDTILSRFVEAHLAPLAEYDERHRSQLIETLRVYYAHGCRKAETARALHLERQSLYKRLARIGALIDADLDDEETQLELQLALRAREMIAGAARAAPSGG